MPSPSWRADCQSFANPCYFMKPEGPSSCSQARHRTPSQSILTPITLLHIVYDNYCLGRRHKFSDTRGTFADLIQFIVPLLRCRVILGGLFRNTTRLFFLKKSKRHIRLVGSRRVIRSRFHNIRSAILGWSVDLTVIWRFLRRTCELIHIFVCKWGGGTAGVSWKCLDATLTKFSFPGYQASENFAPLFLNYNKIMSHFRQGLVSRFTPTKTTHFNLLAVFPDFLPPCFDHSGKVRWVYFRSTRSSWVAIS